MKEYMFLIRNTGDHDSNMSPENHIAFLKACESYIGELKSQGKLIAAQPLERQGKIISGSENKWNETDFKENNEMQVGYYHILASDMEEAISIAKKNPEFAYGSTARIEVRPIKMKENSTGFQYPKSGNK